MQQILGGREVVVARDGADLPLAEFRQRRRLQSFCFDVPAVKLDRFQVKASGDDILLDPQTRA